MSKEKKFRVSAMKGRKISLEDRGPDAKKLGRKFKYDEGEGERVVVTLHLKKGSIEKLLEKAKAESKSKKVSKAKAIADLIEKDIT